MDYIALTNLDKNLVTNKYIYDGNNFNSDSFSFVVNANENISIIFLNINKDFKLEFDIKENANVKLSFLQIAPINAKFRGNVAKNSNLVCYYADFVDGNISLDSRIDLDGEDSSCLWNLASLAKNEEKKDFYVSVYHNSKKTKCHINNYGVTRDKSHLLFSGICKIENGSHESSAHQNSKIMVFDEESDAIAKPILKIDDNDIEASHAAVVGKISDEHMFYLTSRGLSEVEARELITYGYLKPILNGFDDEELSRQINSLIEGSL